MRQTLSSILFFLLIASFALACEAVTHANDFGTSTAAASSDTCGKGTLLCNGNCIAQDAINCSACGVGCTSSQVCSISTVAGAGGTCGSGCTGGTTLCGDACVDTDTDPANCGQCGGPSDAGVTCNFCVQGTCLETCGDTTCGNQCIDTTADPNNCGACGKTCSGSTPVCDTGKCAGSCGGNETACSGGCTDTDLDPKNCGACSSGTKDPHDCKDPQAHGLAVCVARGCGITCETGFTICNGECVCGACTVTLQNPGSGTTCSPGIGCVNGLCGGVAHTG